MEVFFREIIRNSILGWLKDGEDHPDKVTAALCLGNLCCNAKNCQDVIHKVAPALISALGEHQQALVRNVKLQHSILGKKT